MAKEAAELIAKHLARTDLTPKERKSLEGALRELQPALSAQESQTSVVDLRQETYDLLREVRDPSVAEQKEFRDRGYVFVSVEAKTLLQLVQEDPDYFWGDELDYVTARPELRDYALPRGMLVAVKPTELFVPGSFDKDRPTQLAMTKAHSAADVQTINPDARAVMLPATGLALLDKGYRKITTQPLFTTRFGRALDNTSGVDSALVGRAHPGYRLLVGEWLARDGLPDVGAASPVVFTRK